MNSQTLIAKKDHQKEWFYNGYIANVFTGDRQFSFQNCEFHMHLGAVVTGWHMSLTQYSQLLYCFSS